MRRRSIVALVLAVLVIAGARAGMHYQRGAALVIEAAGIRGWSEQVARLNAHRYRVTAARVPTRHGTLAARLYAPDDRFNRIVALFPGVHAAGIDEPRLEGFAREIAERGVAVLSVELPDLKQYAITPRTTDMIEDATRWVSSQRELAPDGRAGMVGISFGGGLTIAAAGRPALADKVAFALSFGGHGDLPRTLRFLCTGRQPDGTYRRPHDYGVVIILLGVADLVVPPEQVDLLRRGIRTFLEASHVDMVDKARAAVIFQSARDQAARMPEPARTFMIYVNNRDVKTLGPLLLPHISALANDPALSAARSPAPHAPVYLLHGSDDTVIPAMESTYLANHLRGHTPVHLLVTPLITHAEVDRPPHIGEVWKLVAFWSGVLGE